MVAVNLVTIAADRQAGAAGIGLLAGSTPAGSCCRLASFWPARCWLEGTPSSGGAALHNLGGLGISQWRI